MGNQFKTLLAATMCALTLVGCGGSSVSDSAPASTSGGTSGGTPSTGGGDLDAPPEGDPSGDGISYLPLTVYEAYKEFSGYESDGLFQGDGQYPYIQSYVINPVNSSDLLPVTTAIASNYTVTIDDVDIDPFESFPMLQKIVGSEASLSTALVFDVSGSVNEVDIQALVNEAKAYVAAAQSHSDETIKTQRFVVWAFGTNIDELTNGFTTVTADINTALDEVVTLFNSNDLGASSNLHKAVLESIGRYTDEAEGYDFSIGDNDLIDSVSMSGTFLSQLVLFSSGPDTALEIDQELMVKAINSQAFVKYVAVSSSEATFLRKPVFYYVVGASSPGVEYIPLSDNSENVSSLVLNGGSYSFASDLIQNQIAAINRRVDTSNQYIYRYAFQPRVGDHTAIFKSNSSAFSYSLTSEYDEDGLDPAIGGPEEEAESGRLPSLVEITGPNGEFISGRFTSVNRDEYIGAIDLSKGNTFAPVTRWVNEMYDPVSDYSWSISGGTGTTNSNGSYTVNSISGATATLTLTNTLRNETAQVIISNQ